MNLTTVMIIVFAMVIIAYCRTDKPARAEAPATKVVEVEITDPMTVEKVRNLYEEQDTYNAKISLLTKQNEQYEHEISQVNERIQSNIDYVNIQLRVQPNVNKDMLDAGCERGNRDLYKHKLKLESMMLTNSEKIVSYKKKSNAISEQITKIGMEAYKRQQMV